MVEIARITQSFFMMPALPGARVDSNRTLGSGNLFAGPEVWMTGACRALTAGVVLVLCPGAGRVQAAAPALRAVNPQASPRTPAASDARSSGVIERTLLDRYCVTCHNQKLKTAGLSLDVMDITKVGEGADVWEKV